MVEYASLFHPTILKLNGNDAGAWERANLHKKYDLKIMIITIQTKNTLNQQYNLTA